VNIAIMRTFVPLLQILATHKDRHPEAAHGAAGTAEAADRVRRTGQEVKHSARSSPTAAPYAA
jgi:hypothetical protein